MAKSKPHDDHLLPIFVYGTLRPGEKNYGRFLQGRTRRETPATVAGRLFFVSDGGYPYLEPGTGRVFGEVVELDSDGYAETLRALDGLEEYDSTNEADSVYLRRQTTATLADGRQLRVWCYYWNLPQLRGVRILSGDFRDRPDSE